MGNPQSRRIETIAARAGHHIDTETGGITIPIQMSTTFERQSDGSFPRGYVYSRLSNPVRDALEKCLTDLEDGSEAMAFGSGSAATAAVLQTLSAGDHVLAPSDAYHGTSRMLLNHFTRWGIDCTFVNMADLDSVRAGIKTNTKLIWTETPSNPMLKVTDIRAVAEIASGAGAILICDNTWATPILQRPLALGADIVVHSTTKYLGGHSDVMGGMVIVKEEGQLSETLRSLQGELGAVPSPFDCWLVLRGIRTLHIRMQAHSAHAAEIASFLENRREVEAVHYPGLELNPGHEVAARQMEGFGGMLSFQVNGGKDEAMDVAARVHLFTRATSLGGTESLIEHRASVEGPESNTPQNLLRVSVGLESPGDLIDDLDQALAHSGDFV